MREMRRETFDSALGLMHESFTREEIREILMAKFLDLSLPQSQRAYNEVASFVANKPLLPQYPVSQGYLMPTKNVPKWSATEQIARDSEERLMIFSNFSIMDEGRSRHKVGTFTHPDYAKLAAYSINFFLATCKPPTKGD
jgi:hypothetical protein